jgi:hypothetical protein
MRRRVIAFRPEFRIMFGILLRPDVAHPPSPSGHTALHHRVDLVRQLGEPLMQPPPEIDLNTSLLEGFSLTFG